MTTLQLQSIDLPAGVTLEYARQGPSVGTPVVFLHGVTDSWRSFERVLASVPEDTPAFALSQRGHGNSSRPDGGYCYQDMADDVRAFLNVLGLPSAVVVGHSMGAMVALEFASRHASMTAGLVVMAGWPTLRGNAAVREFFDSSISGLSDPVDAEFARQFQVSTLARPIAPALLETAINESLKVPARIWKAAFEGFLTNDPSEISRITAPTLIAWGDRDSYSLRAEQEGLLTAIPHAQLTVYEDAGHAFHWEDPVRFAFDLVSWKRRIHRA